MGLPPGYACMIRAIKRLIFLVVLIGILAFIFSDSLLFYTSKWHERSGELKKAMRGYAKVAEKHPGSRWAKKAKEAIHRLNESRKQEVEGSRNKNE